MSTNFQVTTDGLPLFFDHILQEFASTGRTIQDGVKERMPAWKGNLKRSWQLDLMSDGGFTVSTNSPYFEEIETGLPAGYTGTDIDNLEQWVTDKLKVKPINANHVANSIARSYVKRGRQGQNLLGVGYGGPGFQSKAQPGSYLDQINQLLDRV